MLLDILIMHHFSVVVISANKLTLLAGSELWCLWQMLDI